MWSHSTVHKALPAISAICRSLTVRMLRSGLKEWPWPTARRLALVYGVDGMFTGAGCTFRSSPSVRSSATPMSTPQRIKSLVNLGPAHGHPHHALANNLWPRIPACLLPRDQATCSLHSIMRPKPCPRRGDVHTLPMLEGAMRERRATCGAGMAFKPFRFLASFDPAPTSRQSTDAILQERPQPPESAIHPCTGE